MIQLEFLVVEEGTVTTVTVPAAQVISAIKENLTEKTVLVGLYEEGDIRENE